MSQTAMDRDVELLRSISEGDRQAFARFYDQYAQVLFSLAFRVLNDQPEAEDVLREVFAQIWDQARDWHPGQGRPFSWAVALTRNKAVDYLHAYQNRAKLLGQAASEPLVRVPGTPSANDSVRSHQGTELIIQAVAELPAAERRALEITFFTGLAPAEQAGILPASPAAVPALIRSGLLKLRERTEGFV